MKEKTRKQALDKKCLSKWSLLVKMRAGFKCEYCKLPQGAINPDTGKKIILNSHHIYTKNKRTTRFDLDNGICLCQGHHTMSSKFSAHLTGMEFHDRIKKERGEERHDRLMFKSNQIRDKDYDKVLQYLSEEETKIKGGLISKQNDQKQI